MFHVVRLLNDNVSDVRRSLQKDLRARGDEGPYQLLKRSASLLTISSLNRRDYWDDSFAKKTELLESALSLSKTRIHDFGHFRRRVIFSCGSTKLVRETCSNALELAEKGRRNG